MVYMALALSLCLWVALVWFVPFQHKQWNVYMRGHCFDWERGMTAALFDVPPASGSSKFQAFLYSPERAKLNIWVSAVSDRNKWREGACRNKVYFGLIWWGWKIQFERLTSSKLFSTVAVNHLCFALTACHGKKFCCDSFGSYLHKKLYVLPQSIVD